MQSSIYRMTSLAGFPGDENVESQFASVLHEFQLNKQHLDPFVIIARFKGITASQALEVGEKLADDEANPELQEEFNNWDLETKLWNLVEILYSFRVADDVELVEEYKFSSLAIKQENYLRRNPKIRELALINNWIQSNTKSLDFTEQEYQAKWQRTRLAVNNKDLNVLANNSVNENLIHELDVDAPLRTKKSIHPDDASVDSQNFYIIYKLLIANKTQEGIDFANSTGNYALALILVGSTQDYFDPIIDSHVGSMDDSFVTETKASGIKHKLLWKKTVLKLSQQPNLLTYEKLIYSYLSGGDISLNLKESSEDWEETLLLYLSKLYSYHIEQFIISNEPGEEKILESLSLSSPKPQLMSIDDILNSILNGGNKESEDSKHPLRVISGGVMIDQISSLLHSLIRTLLDDSETLMKPYLTRVVTHLSIFQLILLGTESINTKDITTIITLYVSKLSEFGLSELIPIYLSFIPDEKDARETYSLFLTSITDSSERVKQIEMSKKIANPLSISEDDLVVINGGQEGKMENVLRRTVERVMEETESHYKPQASLVVHDDTNIIDNTDFKLYRSVEWFYENNMYEDAISATITIIRRFLLSGKLSSLQQFAVNKSFKKLIRDYDSECHTKSLSSDDYKGAISEEQKQELLEYTYLIEALNIIDEWKSFLTSHKINGIGRTSGLWDTTEVENSIEKTTKTLDSLIFKWFNELIWSSNNSEDGQLFEEMRSIYIPYLIIELLQIYQNARFKDWRYIRKAFKVINEVANEAENDFLKCFTRCGRLDEFLVKAGELSVVASERGVSGVFS